MAKKTTEPAAGEPASQPEPTKATAKKAAPAKPARVRAPAKAVKRPAKIGQRITDPEAIFASLMAAVRQGGGDHAKLCLQSLLEKGIRVTFLKANAVAHVPNSYR